MSSQTITNHHSPSSLQVTIRPTAKQHQTRAFLQDHRTNEVLFGGGAGGGKSRLGCEWLLESALRYPGSRWLLGRAVLKNLKESTLLTFFEVASSWGLKPNIHYQYNQQESVINFWNGSAIYLKDLAYYPSDPNYDALGSTEYTGAFIDEANQIRAKAKDVVVSRVRYKLDVFGLIPKVLMTCNPDKGWVYTEFYQPHRDGTLPPHRAFVQALATDNPHISPLYIESLKRLRDPAMQERLLRGNWEYDDDPAALYDRDALHDLFTNTVESPSEHFLTCDAARLGRDKCVIAVWEGLKVIHLTSYDRSRTTQVEAEIERLCSLYRIPRSQAIVDEDGVGGGIVDHLNCKGFVGGSSPLPERRESGMFKPNYQNLRTQCYYALSDAVRDHRLAVPVATPYEQDLIVDELAQIKGRDVDKDNKIKIVGKDEIKKRLGRSPDYADALMMRMWFELQPVAQPVFVAFGD